MITKPALLACCLAAFLAAPAQVFINKARIEYEVTSNIQKTMGSGFFEDMLKDNLPPFKVGYYDLTFDGDHSVYKFDHWSTDRKLPTFLTSGDEQSAWYCNYEDGLMQQQKSVWGSELEISDTLPKLQWRITNDTRVIAGFNCRKAFTIIFDSVYVFAFYTDEITVSGGPCSIHGLPGMILGMTIPRLYTSWIATRVTVNDVDAKAIQHSPAKKSYDLKFLESTIRERTKDWYSDDADEEKEILQQRARTLWLMML